VIALPGAAAEPVVQRRGPGRYPRCVVRLDRWRRTQDSDRKQQDRQHVLNEMQRIGCFLVGFCGGAGTIEAWRADSESERARLDACLTQARQLLDWWRDPEHAPRPAFTPDRGGR
jgi:hypothetical protein